MPFYNLSGGLQINGTQQTAITLEGAGVTVNGDVISIPGVTFSNGTLAIESSLLQLSGTGQTLTLGATAPAIVQSKFFTQQEGNLALLNAVSTNNVLVFVTFFGNGPVAMPNTWTQAAYANSGQLQGYVLWHNPQNAADNFFPMPSFGGYMFGCLFEISGCSIGESSFAVGAATVAGDAMTGPTIGQADELLIAGFANYNAYATFSAELPAGSTVEGQFDNQVSGVVYSKAMTAAAEIGVTSSVAPGANCLYLYSLLTPSAQTANLAIT
jgi:hypothetical protein